MDVLRGEEEPSEVLAKQEKSISGGHVTRTSTSGLFISSSPSADDGTGRHTTTC